MDRLEELGYEWAYRTVDSRFTGVPQRRYRVILLASLLDDPGSRLFSEPDAHVVEPDTQQHDADPERRLPHGFYWTEGRTGLGLVEGAIPTLKGGSTLGTPSAPAVWFPSAERGRRFVLPTIEDGEAIQGLPRGWTAPAAVPGERDLRWKLVGNAVTSGIGAWLGRRLMTLDPQSSVIAGAQLVRNTRWPQAASGGPGRPAVQVEVSDRPLSVPMTSLDEVIDVTTAPPLSHRATKGFLSRVDEKPNRRVDEQWYADLEDHLVKTVPKGLPQEKSSWASSAGSRARMQKQKQRDTKPELSMRRELSSLGLRYRLQTRPEADLRCRLDIVFKGPKVAVDIRGCFWHGCELHGTKPKLNAERWADKLRRNRERDEQTVRALQGAGVACPCRVGARRSDREGQGSSGPRRRATATPRTRLWPRGLATDADAGRFGRSEMRTSRSRLRPTGVEADPVMVAAQAGQDGHAATIEQTPRELGAIFTRRWVAELVLDLAGYTADEPLWADTVIEPACGHGAFLDVIVDRLLVSCERAGVDPRTLGAAIVAMDVDPDAVAVSRAATSRRLTESGMSRKDATKLARSWIRAGDFLKSARSLPLARWVVGNPPYVRIEDVSREDMAVYRAEWTTMSGRADLYVGFYEAGLGRLKEGGRLTFICADRWMRNRYGAGLRALVEQDFCIDACIVMHAVDAFEDRVSAYPAITVIGSDPQGEALVVDASDAFDSEAASRLVKAYKRGAAPVVVDDTFRASWLPTWPRGAGSWPAAVPEQLALLSALEARLPTLAETDAHVSVGVATGADDVYVVSSPDLVEAQFLHPTLAARETAFGGIEWKRRYLVSPWTAEGLADLEEFPRLSAYLQQNRPRLVQRHVAKNNPERWWRTIDRVDPRIVGKQKLLVPDLKDRIHPVYDQGMFMPLHSLYYITSESWDLPVLGGLLMSDIANMFVEAYSVRMANGYMRVSAQYLRRVRVPRPEALSRQVADELRTAFWERDRVKANAAAELAYGVSFVGPVST